MENIEETKVRIELYKDKWVTQRDWRTGKLLDSYIKVQKVEIRPYSISSNITLRKVVAFGKTITTDKESGSLKYTRDGILKFASGFKDILATEEQVKQFEALVNTCESFLK